MNPCPPPQAVAVTSTLAWKIKSIEKMRCSFFFQAKKSSILFKRPGRRAKISRGYGVPEKLEYICRGSGMVIAVPLPHEVKFYRKYWYNCWQKSKEIYWWLCDLPPSRYNYRLHLYLVQLLFTGRPLPREINRYEKARADQNGKPDPDRSLHIYEKSNPGEIRPLP